MNPWKGIKLEDYENHMRDKRVFQLQTLYMIMEEQARTNPRTVAILGVAGGNGLEHLENAEAIYAVDINEDYLRRCWDRYGYLGDKLILVPGDLEVTILPPCELLMCNLIIEYVGIDVFAKFLKRSKFDVASCVIQKNCGEDFISTSETAEKLLQLKAVHRDVDEEELLEKVGLNVILRKSYVLPDNKEFIRLDFEGVKV